MHNYVNSKIGHSSHDQAIRILTQDSDVQMGTVFFGPHNSRDFSLMKSHACLLGSQLSKVNILLHQSITTFCREGGC